MGTSGAYGGSGTQDWRTVRTLFDQLSADDDGGEGVDGATTDDTSIRPGEDLADLTAAIATALRNEDDGLRRPAGPTPLATLMPRRGQAGSGGGGGAGGGVRSEGRPQGRSGGGSTRSVGRAAARGGVALGGGFALRRGDREGLAELGLDLDELRKLGPRSQCARILEAVLGETGHPDEGALRAAAAEQLKAIVTLDVAPSQADALRGFIAAFVFQLALVELRSQLAQGDVDVAVAAKKEGRMRRYIERRVAHLNVPDAGSLKIAEFGAHADRLAIEIVEILRAR